MPLPRVVDITDQLSSALTAAHSQGSSIATCTRRTSSCCRAVGQDGERVKILDFGISKIASVPEESPAWRRCMGTPHYMSPEQAEGKTDELDAASDQFSLAAIVYEMLTGRPAFSGDTLASVAYQVVHATPRSGETYAPRCRRRSITCCREPWPRTRAIDFLRCRSSRSTFAGRPSLARTAARAAGRRTANRRRADAVVNRADETTAVSALPSGMAAVLRQTHGGASSTGADRRCRSAPLAESLLVAALVGGALALAAARPADATARTPSGDARNAGDRSATADPPTARRSASTAGRGPTRGRPARSTRRKRRTTQVFSGARGERPTRGRAAPDAPNVAGEPARAESRERPRSRRRSPVRPRRCRLTVGSYPWSELWIDGADTGQQTPVVGLPVTCGAAPVGAQARAT